MFKVWSIKIDGSLIETSKFSTKEAALSDAERMRSDPEAAIVEVQEEVDGVRYHETWRRTVWQTWHRV